MHCTIDHIIRVYRANWSPHHDPPVSLVLGNRHRRAWAPGWCTFCSSTGTGRWTLSRSGSAYTRPTPTSWTSRRPPASNGPGTWSRPASSCAPRCCRRWAADTCPRARSTRSTGPSRSSTPPCSGAGRSAGQGFSAPGPACPRISSPV